MMTDTAEFVEEPSSPFYRAYVCRDVRMMPARFETSACRSSLPVVGGVIEEAVAADISKVTTHSEHSHQQQQNVSYNCFSDHKTAMRVARSSFDYFYTKHTPPAAPPLLPRLSHTATPPSAHQPDERRRPTSRRLYSLDEYHHHHTEEEFQGQPPLNRNRRSRQLGSRAQGDGMMHSGCDGWWTTTSGGTGKKCGQRAGRIGSGENTAPLTTLPKVHHQQRPLCTPPSSLYNLRAANGGGGSGSGITENRVVAQVTGCRTEQQKDNETASSVQTQLLSTAHRRLRLPAANFDYFDVDHGYGVNARVDLGTSSGTSIPAWWNAHGLMKEEENRSHCAAPDNDDDAVEVMEHRNGKEAPPAALGTTTTKSSTQQTTMVVSQQQPTAPRVSKQLHEKLRRLQFSQFVTDVCQIAPILSRPVEGDDSDDDDGEEYVMRRRNLREDRDLIGNEEDRQHTNNTHEQDEDDDDDNDGDKTTAVVIQLRSLPPAYFEYYLTICSNPPPTPPAPSPASSSSTEMLLSDDSLFWQTSTRHNNVAAALEHRSSVREPKPPPSLMTRSINLQSSSRCDVLQGQASSCKDEDIRDGRSHCSSSRQQRIHSAMLRFHWHYQQEQEQQRQRSRDRRGDRRNRNRSDRRNNKGALPMALARHVEWHYEVSVEAVILRPYYTWIALMSCWGGGGWGGAEAGKASHEALSPQPPHHYAGYVYKVAPSKALTAAPAVTGGIGCEANGGSVLRTMGVLWHSESWERQRIRELMAVALAKLELRAAEKDQVTLEGVDVDPKRRSDDFPSLRLLLDVADSDKVGAHDEIRIRRQGMLPSLNFLCAFFKVSSDDLPSLRFLLDVADEKEKNDRGKCGPHDETRIRQQGMLPSLNFLCGFCRVD